MNYLGADYMRCLDRLDWVAKLAWIREFLSAQNLADDDPWLLSLDLEYHRLDPAEGLYFGLEQAGAMRGVPDETAVRQAVLQPPSTTRALIRGQCVQKFAKSIVSAQWDHVTLSGVNDNLRISLLDLFDLETIQRLARSIDDAATPDEIR